MKSIFPEPIQQFPEAAIPLEGCQAFLSQAGTHQIIFMEFQKDVNLPEHQHESQWGIVLEGRIDLVIDGKPFIFQKGDRYFIPKDVKHSGKVHAGYADMTFFNQKDRYKIKIK
jgi:quercetin dioxygenase-like cupin family protein